MIIVADENIPFVREAFAPLGEVRLSHGRKMTQEVVKDATLLLVRSITKVNESLLKDTAVKFVATATIGMEHVDQEYLKQRGVAFASAPGSNANSVSEYITAALLVIAKRRGFALAGKSIGIVGVGNVGSRVEKKMRALGLKVKLNDPPLAEQTGDPKYRPLEELLDCDILTFHVPLEKAGKHPTRHMVNVEFLKRVKRGTILLNSSRGSVADNAEVLKAIESGALRNAVLDVWEGEPSINAALMERVAIGTPHIAGYSYDGKVNGTEMIYRAACAFLGRKPEWNPATCMPAPEVAEIDLRAATGSTEEILRAAIEQVYSIERDDAALRGTMSLPAEKRGAAFDLLRKEYPRRREFQNTRVLIQKGEAATKLAGLGFIVING